MGLGVSLILMAVGAILTWAVTADAEGINVDAVGVILMVVGLVGFLLSLMFWSSWWGPGWFSRRATYVEGAAPVAAPRYRRRRAVVDEPVVEEVEVVEERAPGPPPA